MFHPKNPGPRTAFLKLDCSGTSPSQHLATHGLANRQLFSQASLREGESTSSTGQVHILSLIQRQIGGSVHAPESR